MSWFDVSDHAVTRKCREHQSTGKCGCVSRRFGNNPCDIASDIAQSATDLALGYSPAKSVAEIEVWLEKHQCNDSRRFGDCEHPACGRVRRLLVWVGQKVAA